MSTKITDGFAGDLKVAKWGGVGDFDAESVRLSLEYAVLVAKKLQMDPLDREPK